jgi:hypothetical protein
VLYGYICCCLIRKIAIPHDIAIQIIEKAQVVSILTDMPCLAEDFSYAYILRYGGGDGHQFDEARKALPHKCEDLPHSRLERMIFSYHMITGEDMKYFIVEESFIEIYQRASEVPFLLSEDAKNIACEYYPFLNLLFREFSHPHFLKTALSFRRRENLLPALKAFSRLTEMCTVKVQLAAHWFHVDDLDI